MGFEFELKKTIPTLQKWPLQRSKPVWFSTFCIKKCRLFFVPTFIFLFRLSDQIKTDWETITMELKKQVKIFKFYSEIIPGGIWCFQEYWKIGG